MPLEALRQQLADLLLPPVADGPGVATGLAELDAALPGGGMPRGRLTEVVGARGSGKTTLARQLVESAAGEGLWVAYVDAERTLAPQDWAHLGEGQGVWMIRPRDPTRAGWCADVLLRSGAFSLVLLDGAPRLSRQVAVRLTRLARESNAALVVLGEESGGSATVLGGAVRLRVDGKRRKRDWGLGRVPAAGGRMPSAATLGTSRGTPPSPQGRGPSSHQLLITLEKGGTYRTVEVSCAIGVARRLCTHPEVPDRRGVARRGDARGVAGAAAPAPAPVPAAAGVAPAGAPAGVEPAHPQRVLARSRRCAEPEYGRERGVSRALRIAIARARSG
jgi:hypothetical protein